MAISDGAAGAWTATTTRNPTVTLPSHSAGDMLLVRMGWKSSTPTTDVAVCNTPGWAKVGQFYNSGGASSNGGGGVLVAVFWKVATSGSETDPVIEFDDATAPTPGAYCAVTYTKGAGESWETPVGDGGGIAAATSYSGTIQSHVAAASGDMLDAFAVTNDNTTLTVPTVAQTGLTLDTVTEYPATALSSGTSNDISADGCNRLATAGTSSAAAVVSGTNSVADPGAAWVTRLRVTSSQSVTLGLLDASPALYAPTVSQPSSGASFVQHIGDTSNGTAGTTSTVLSVSKTVTVGNSILVGFGAWYNPSTATDPTATDNLGNTYDLDDSHFDGIRGAHVFRAEVTTGGTLTSITVTHQAADYKTLLADEFADVGPLSSGSGITAAFSGATAAVWDSNQTIPGDGLGFGFVHTDGAVGHTAGAASGSPSTTPVLGTYRADGANISGSTHYALAGGSDVTGFDGNISFGGSTAGLAAGANYDPPGAGAQSITLGLIDAAPALYAPTLVAKSTVTLGLLDGARAIYAPTLAPKSSVTLGLIDGGPSIYAPTVAPKSTVTLPLIDGARALYAPTVIVDQFVTLGLLDGGPALYAPVVTVGAVTVTLGLIDAGSALYAPAVAQEGGPQTADLPLIDAGAALYAPTVIIDQFVTLGLIDAASAIYAPTVSPGPVVVALGLIDAGAAVYAPSVVQSGGPQAIDLDLLDGARVLYAPTILPGSVGIALGLLDAGSTVYAPVVAAGGTSVALELIDSGPALYAPAIDPAAVALGLALIDAGPALYAPTLSWSIALGLIDAGSALYAPTAWSGQIVGGPAPVGRAVTLRPVGLSVVFRPGATSASPEPAAVASHPTPEE